MSTQILADRRVRVHPVLRSLLPKIALACLLATMLPSTSLAQEKRLEIAGFIGGLSITQDLGTADNIYYTTTGTAENISFGSYLGVRIAFFFTPFIGIEGNLSRGTNSYTLTVDDDELGIVDLGEQFEAKQLNYGGALVFQYPMENGLAPYGVAGYGRQSGEPTSPIAGVESATGNDFTFGGGVKYFFNGIEMSWLGARFDYRYHFISSGIAFEGNDVSPRHSELTFGVVIRPF